MNKENTVAMLRKFMDSSVEILGRMIVRGLGIVSDRNINALELVIELGDIIDSVNSLVSIRRYIINLMTPYAITINFDSMPRTASDLKSYFAHVYEIPKYNLRKTLLSIETPPCIFVLAVRNKTDHRILKDFIEVYAGKDHVPGVIVFFTNPSHSGLDGPMSQIKSMFSGKDMSSPMICMDREALHKMCKQFYIMCRNTAEENES